MREIVIKQPFGRCWKFGIYWFGYELYIRLRPSDWAIRGGRFPELGVRWWFDFGPLRAIAAV